MVQWCSKITQLFLPKNKFESLAEFSYLWSEIGVLNIYNLVGRVGDARVVVNVWVHVPGIASCLGRCISPSFNLCLPLLLNWGMFPLVCQCLVGIREDISLDLDRVFCRGPSFPFSLSIHLFSLSFSFVYAGIPLVRLPTICRVPLDLYRAYNSVQQLGGFVNVS